MSNTKTRLRVILDTNVLISAMLNITRAPHQCVQYSRANMVLLYSHDTLIELMRVLQKPKIRQHLPHQRIEFFLKDIVHRWQFIDTVDNITACRDADDNKFLSLAVAGSVDYLITGDEDLLILHPFQEITICTPAVFLKTI